MGRWKNIQPWLAAALVAALAAIWLATAHFQIIERLQFVGAAPMRPVSSGHELLQTFTAPTDQISRIDLTLSKPDPGVGGRLLIQLVEISAQDTEAGIAVGAPLREVSFDTQSLDYTVINRFEFEPVAVRPGGIYGIRLTSDDPEEIAVRAGASPGSDYDGGRLFIDGKPTDADLYFALFREGDAGELLQKIGPFRPFPLNSTAFNLAVLLVGAGAFGWLLWAVAGGVGGVEAAAAPVEEEKETV
ncbi:MAG: hypothetical protein ACYCXF_08795 [Thermoleophilia bacterium]